MYLKSPLWGELYLLFERDTNGFLLCKLVQMQLIHIKLPFYLLTLFGTGEILV